MTRITGEIVIDAQRTWSSTSPPTKQTLTTVYL